MARRWLPTPLVLLSFGFIFSSSAIAQNNVVGQWSPVMTWPYEAIHAHLLPTGEALYWNKGKTADMIHPTFWNPATNASTAATDPAANIFCSGEAFLPDGRLLVAGGHVHDYVGLPDAYSPFTNSWTHLPDMNNGRWYPTNTALPNGDVLVTSGWIDSTQGVNVEPQVWQTATNSWRNLTTAHLDLPFYPFMHVAPNGRVFFAGPSQATRYLDASGTGAWSLVGNSNFGTRSWGSSVMYYHGKVLLMAEPRTSPIRPSVACRLHPPRLSI